MPKIAPAPQVPYYMPPPAIYYPRVKLKHYTLKELIPYDGARAELLRAKMTMDQIKESKKDKK